MASERQRKSSPAEDSNQQLSPAANAVPGHVVQENAPVELKKQLNLFQSVCIIVGMVIGSGIFVSPVGITQNVHSVGLSLVVWVLVGLFSLLCALCFAELGSCLPESGGEYTYILRSLGEFPAFMCLWVFIVLAMPVSTAAHSLVFATYLVKPLYPDCPPPAVVVRLFAALIVGLLVVINCQNVKYATKLQVVITLSKVAAIVAIIMIGFVWMGKGDTQNFQNSFEGSDYSPGALALAFHNSFFAFTGWNCLNCLAEEVMNPTRTMPLAIMISISVCVVINVSVNVAYFVALAPHELLQSSAVAVTFLERTVSSLAYVVPLLIAFSVIGSINGGIMALSRVFYVAARNNHLPRVISMIRVRNPSPAPSLICMLVLILIMQSMEDIILLIEMNGFTYIVVLVCVFAGQVVMRWTRPDLHRPIKVPVAIPAFICLSFIGIVTLTIYQKPYECSLALLAMALGGPAYVIGIIWRKPSFIQRVIVKVTIVLQKLMLVAFEDKASGSNLDDEDVTEEREER